LNPMIEEQANWVTLTMLWVTLTMLPTNFWYNITFSK
jgi:hypothetical protein